ncbi:hypothetical protein GCM10009000_064760 [Halobacterium noricense]|uniref:Uncharacterized protein n=1 Tax=Haladaptatus pallidirubidus TaxID=1008152 RepID=A0AAV3UI08_9EURY
MEKPHIVIGGSEVSAEQTSERTGADDRDLHAVSFPPLWKYVCTTDFTEISSEISGADALSLDILGHVRFRVPVLLVDDIDRGTRLAATSNSHTLSLAF